MTSISPSNSADLQAYISGLEALANETANRSLSRNEMLRLEQVLLDEPARRLRDFLPIESRRQQGMFLTSFSLASELVSFTPSFSYGRILDPACGAGDLLLAAARKLPVVASLQRTLQAWGTQIVGYDLDQTLVRAARMRLILLARFLGARGRVNVQNAFPQIRTANALNFESQWPTVRNRRCFVLANPPYQKVPIPSGYDWSKGSVTAASLFVCKILELLSPGSVITAVLPDVLRSGSRYQRWRRWVETRAEAISIKTLGKFDDHADVHVFLFSARIKQNSPAASIASWYNLAGERSVLSEYFDVKVGPVVDYREPKKGHWQAFARTQSLPRWSAIESNKLPKRRFSGALYKPPLLLLRRNSRPEDKHRIVPTLVTGDRSIAVENHLLVLLPKKGTVAECEEAMSLFKNGSIASWMNQRLRCRHLTVEAVRGIPWK